VRPLALAAGVCPFCGTPVARVAVWFEIVRTAAGSSASWSATHADDGDAAGWRACAAAPRGGDGRRAGSLLHEALRTAGTAAMDQSSPYLRSLT
jgi:hypothetical protein